MGIESISLIFSGAINIFLGVLLLKRKQILKSNIFFSSLAFCTGLWSFCLYFFQRASTEDSILFWGRSAFVFAAAVSFYFFMFCVYFPDNRKHIKSLYIVLPSLSFLTMVFLSIKGNLFIESGTKLKGVSALIYNDTISIYGLYTIVLFVLGFGILLKKYKKYSGTIRLQLKYIFIGVFFSVVVSFVASFVLTYFQDFRYNWVGPVSTLVMIGCVFYVIIRYRLMGIRMIVSRIYVYLGIAIFSLVFSRFTYYVEERIFESIWGADPLIISLLVALGFAVVVLPFIEWVQKSSDRLFFSGSNPKRIIKDLIIRMGKVIDLDALLEFLVKEFGKILHVEDVRILILDKKSIRKISKRYSYRSIELTERNPIFKTEELIVKDEIKNSNKTLFKELRKNKIEVISPLVSQGKIIGFILLGEKLGNEGYTKGDLSFVQIISSHSAVAIENALLHKEIEDFNRNLQKKVNEQTTDIKKKAEHLKKLLEMRSEFLDVASHQLRTPTSVIKGMLSMIVNGSVGDKKKDEFIKASLQKSFKLEEIINDILRASEMDSDKFNLKLKVVNIKDVIRKIYEEKISLATKKNINLKLNLPSKKNVNIMSDDRYLEHALRNIVNNAIQYTQKGDIVVSLIESNGRIIFKVKDSGIGIPKKDISKLFKKFERAENAVNAYTDGSGLGLFIARKIIDAHQDSDIYVESSKIGEGTVMAIEFPMIKK